jgi:TIR domain
MPTSIFISYSRRDALFVTKIGAALEACGYKVWIDRKDIHPTADWLETLLRGIADSDYFAAVLTPDLLSSDICKVELNQATALRKNFVPILLHDIGPLPQEIARFQWVDFRDPVRFDASFEELSAALKQDPEWREMHTHLLTAAMDWERHGHPWSRLLHGAEIEDAEKWLADADQKTRIPAPQHQTYIPVSRRFARRWKLGLTGALAPLLSGVGLGFYVSGHRGKETRARELVARAARVATNPQRLEESAIMAIEASDRLRDLRVSSTDAETVLRGSLKQLLRPISAGSHPAGIGGMAIDPARGMIATFAGSLDANVSPIDSNVTDNTVRIWRTTGGPLILTLRHESMVFAAVFDAKGLLVTGDLGGRVSVWDLSSPITPSFVFDQKSPIVSLAASGTTPLLAAASSNGNVTVWDLRTRLKKYSYNDGQGPGAELVTISPDSRYIASGGEHGIVQVRTLADSRIVKTLKHQSGGAIKAIIFSPASDQLATGGEGGEFHLWSIPAGKDQFPLAHRDTVHSIWYAGGHTPYISTASSDGSLRTIESSFNRGWKTREFPAGYALWTVATDPEGRYIGAARGDGLVDF